MAERSPPKLRRWSINTRTRRPTKNRVLLHLLPTTINPRKREPGSRTLQRPAGISAALARRLISSLSCCFQFNSRDVNKFKWEAGENKMIRRFRCACAPSNFPCPSSHTMCRSSPSLVLLRQAVMHEGRRQLLGRPCRRPCLTPVSVEIPSPIS